MKPQLQIQFLAESKVTLHLFDFIFFTFVAGYVSSLPS